MKNEDTKNKIKEWVSGLSAETLNDLSKILSAIIPVSEVVGSNAFNFSCLPFEEFNFANHGFDNDRVSRILVAISSVANYNEEINVENNKLYLSVSAIELLIYVKSLAEKKLSGKQITEQPSVFKDDEAKLIVDGITVQLPPHKNEHWFCRAMDEHSPNEPVDWDQLYEEISGNYKGFFGKLEDTKNPKRMVYDTVEAINGRLKKIGLSKLYIWQENTVKRLR